jgi:transposase
MRPYGTPQQLEKRRRQAIALLKEGHSYRSVATKLKSSLSSVVRWYQAYRKKGKEGLRPQPTPGRPPRLTKAQKEKLLRILVKGAPFEGYATDLWALPRIARVICKHFRVRYHPGHVWWLMKGLRWSCQKPERRALERDEEAIARWKRHKWPAINKNSKTWGPSGFC